MSDKDFEKLRKKMDDLEGRLGVAEKTKSSWKMFRELWPTVPADCRFGLFWEFVLNPMSLKNRYENEAVFKSKMDNRWK